MFSKMVTLIPGGDTTRVTGNHAFISTQPKITFQTTPLMLECSILRLFPFRRASIRR
jgi:hypothetical protein